MINLLDPRQQKELRAARLNTKLLFFTTLLVGITLGIGAVYGVGFWIVATNKTSAEANKIKTEENLKKYTAATDAATAYRQQLTTARTIFESRILFSDLLIKFGALMPKNTILTNLNLTTEAQAGSAGAGTQTLSVRGKSYEDILAVERAFKASNILSNVQIINIVSPQKDISLIGSETAYPYAASIQVVINELKG